MRPLVTRQRNLRDGFRFMVLLVGHGLGCSLL
jgi:hypothetical protein